MRFVQHDGMEVVKLVFREWVDGHVDKEKDSETHDEDEVDVKDDLLRCGLFQSGQLLNMFLHFFLMTSLRSLLFFDAQDPVTKHSAAVVGIGRLR